MLAKALPAEKENLRINPSRDEFLPLPEWKEFDGINLPPSGWLGSLRDGNI